MSDTEPVDQPDRATVEVRQGTGPREMVSVLLLSLAIAAFAGIALMAYFTFSKLGVDPQKIIFMTYLLC